MLPLSIAMMKWQTNALQSKGVAVKFLEGVASNTWNVHMSRCMKSYLLKFPNAVALNVVGCRNTQMSANESKRTYAKEHKRAQMTTNERLCVKIANNPV